MTKPVLTHIAEKLRPLARDVSKLKHDPRNARRHGRRNLDAIRFSLSENGQVKPIVVAADGTVIAGNGTLDAALELGWTHLAVVEFAGTPEQAKRFAIQDNRTAELAEWEDAELAALLADLRTAEEGSLESLGFTDLELDRLMAEQAPVVSGTTNATEEWKGMPEFNQPDASGIRMVVHFASTEDRDAFAKLIGQTFTPKTRSIWFPAAEWDRASEDAYVDDEEEPDAETDG